MMVQELLQWLLKQRQSFVEIPEKCTRWQSVEILAAEREADLEAREGDLEERNGEGGLLSPSEEGFEPDGIEWGGDEGDEDAAMREESGDVGHGYHVALSHERD